VTGEAHALAIQKMGQCPIWVLGKDGEPPSYQYGWGLKEEEGVDLGDVNEGIAYYGNMDFQGMGEQDGTIFIINMQEAILRHPTVFIHELSHYFHDFVGEHKTPQLTEVYKATLKKKKAIEAAYTIHNPEQFEVTFCCAEEFFAYMMEAYYSKPKDFSPHGIEYTACAFPSTITELLELDVRFQLGIVDVLGTILPLTSLTA